MFNAIAHALLALAPEFDAAKVEDVPMSLVPISELARIAGVPTPNIDAVIQLTSSIYQRDFRAEGRCAKNLGIEGMSKAQVTHFFETGER